MSEVSRIPRMRRRPFLQRVGTGWALFAAASTSALGATARFFFPNDRPGHPGKFRIGYPGDIALGVQVRWEGDGFWVVRDPHCLYALSTVCTHLGCKPDWLSAEAKFKCPCHGSGFYMTGMNFEGPAPRPLERFKISLASDGQIEVDKSQTFLHEKGEWEDPRSFLRIAVEA